MTESGAHRFGGLPVFFAFAEGQFGYDCRGCGAPCCREAGALYIETSQAELLDRLGCQLLVTSQRGDAIGFRIGRGGCPARLGRGDCAIHAELGRLAKPALCALFPFSNTTNTGTFLALSPNITFVCPLRIDARPGDTRATHQEILDDLRHFFGDSAASFHHVDLPADNATTIEVETRVLEAVNELRGRATLTEALAAAAGGSASTLSHRLNGALALAGAEPLPEDRESCRELLPLVPTLRTWLYDLRTDEIDIALLAGWHLVSRIAAASSEPLDPRRIATLFRDSLELLSLLARAERPVRLSGTPKRGPGGDPEVALETALVLRDIPRAPQGTTLAELIERNVRSTGYRRTLVLRALTQAGLELD